MTLFSVSTYISNRTTLVDYKACLGNIEKDCWGAGWDIVNIINEMKELQFVCESPAGSYANLFFFVFMCRCLMLSVRSRSVCSS